MNLIHSGVIIILSVELTGDGQYKVLAVTRTTNSIVSSLIKVRVLNLQEVHQLRGYRLSNHRVFSCAYSLGEDLYATDGTAEADKSSPTHKNPYRGKRIAGRRESSPRTTGLLQLISTCISPFPQT
jgi:hypothetical protein